MRHDMTARMQAMEDRFNEKYERAMAEADKANSAVSSFGASQRSPGSRTKLSIKAFAKEELED